MYLIKRLSAGSAFSKNFITLLSGTAVSQAIPVLISPILTRLYTPADIGIFAVYFGVSGIASMVITGRYEMAILLPKEDRQAKELVILSVLLSMICTFLSCVGIFFFKESIASALGLNHHSNLIYLLPFLSIASSFYQIITYWLNRKSDYHTMARGKVCQSTVMSVIQVVFSMWGEAALLMGRLLGVMAGTLYSIPTIFKRGLSQLYIINDEGLKATAKEYSDFPKYSMTNSLVNSLSGNLPIFLLTRFFSLTETGFFSWSSRIIQVPMGMITTSMQQVFFQECSRLRNEGKSVYSLVMRTYKKLFVMAVLPFLVFGIFSPFIFRIVFGQAWEQAGVYTQYLAPWLFIVFLNSPITSIVPVLNKQKEYLVFEILALALRYTALFVGYRFFHSVHVSIILYSGVGFVYTLCMFFYLIRLAKNN